MTKWILASASPRRRELLRQMGLQFEVVPAVGEEKSSLTFPEDYVRELAEHKAREVYRRTWASGTPDRPGSASCAAAGRQDAAAGPCRDRVCVIGADTIVVCDGRILGKPADRREAAEMLRLLQGRSHQVMTGTALMWGETSSGGENAGMNSFCCTTDVSVAPMEEEEIAHYLATGEADDKAGAYGIQGAFGIYIQSIRGDYYNVVGLPICEVYHTIRKLGL